MSRATRAVALVCCLALSTPALADPSLLDADEPDDGDRVGRVAAEFGAAILAAALPNLLWVPFVTASGGSSSAAGPILALIAISLEPLSICTASWLVHRKMRGRGLWPAAFGGTMLGAALGGLVFGFGAGFTGLRDPTQNVSLVVGSSLIVIASTVFILELHHDDTVAASVAPLPGGAIGTVTVRF